MPISSMSATWSISEKSVWFLLALSGFLLMVAIEIGSLACLTCFCRVALSSIFWSISKPYSQNFVDFLRRWQCNSSWNFFQVIQLLIRVEHQKSHFLHTLLVYHAIFLLNWYVVTQVLPENIVCFVVMLSLVCWMFQYG